MTGLTTFLSQHFFDLISLIGIVGALLFSARQNFLATKAIGAQSFLNLHQLEALSRGKNGEDGIAAITCTGYLVYPFKKQALRDGERSPCNCSDLTSLID